MSEKTMRHRIVRGLREIDAISVENRVGAGTPDVNYVEGWLELKWLRCWPKNAETSPVLLPHFTPQQRNWLRRRHLRDGNAFLLWQVGQEYLLFEGDTAAAVVGRYERPILLQAAVRHWPRGMNYQELIQWLQKTI